MEKDEAPDTRDLRYLHSPFLNPADFLRAREWLRYAPPPAPPVRRFAFPERPPLRSRLADPTLDPWHQHHFSPTEQDVWMAHGLTPHEVGIAVACREQGLEPPTLWNRVDGRTVHDWLRAGEPVASVAARLRGTTARTA